LGESGAAVKYDPNDPRTHAQHRVGSAMMRVSIILACALVALPAAVHLALWLTSRFTVDQLFGGWAAGLVAAMFLAAFGDAFKRNAFHYFNARKRGDRQ
jgi:hypothetical protein